MIDLTKARSIDRGIIMILDFSNRKSIYHIVTQIDNMLRSSFYMFFKNLNHALFYSRTFFTFLHIDAGVFLRYKHNKITLVWSNDQFLYLNTIQGTI